MENSKLIFSSGGTSANIQFKTGGESLEFETKEEALYAIRDCYSKGLITFDEQNEFIKEVVMAKNMPNTHSKIPFMIRALIAMLVSEELTECKITNPTVKLCTCSRSKAQAHAHIYDEDETRISPPFLYKSDGFAYVEYLHQSERIDEKCKENLLVLIDLLKLPEDSGLN